MKKLARTYLFVPATRPERIDKALASGADVVIVDLEDAVSPEQKDTARATLGDWLIGHPNDCERLALRINDPSTPWYAADVTLAATTHWHALVLPKAELPSQISALHAAAGGVTPVVPIVESARGLLAVEALASTPGVLRIAFGTLDYAVDLGMSGDERGLIEPSTRIALASRAAEIAAPIAGVTTDIGNEPQLLADLAFARAFGFSAKLCIHPRQVEALHRALAPTAADIEWAHRVLAAAAASSGAVQLDGKMIDRPVILKAQGILAASGGEPREPVGADGATATGVVRSGAPAGTPAAAR